MADAGIRCPRIVLATTLACFTSLCGPAAGVAGAAEAAPPVGFEAATEKIREIIREDGGDSAWGAEPPEAKIASRGEPFAATLLSGAGHAMVMIGSDGQPKGSHLRLLHVRVEDARASASECVLRLGQDEDRSCPPAPPALVDCATWSVPADAARAAMLAARTALFVRVYEKKLLSDPYEEYEDGGVPGGVVGGVFGGTSANFVAAVNIREAGENPIRVSQSWAGYVSGGDVGRYARAVAATRILREAFPRPSDAPASAPPSALHVEFSRLLDGRLPLDEKFWWWVRERMVLMAATLGLPADLERLEGYLNPQRQGLSELRTRAYALEALARRTRRDTRCDGGRRLTDEAAAAAWAAPQTP